MPTACQLCPSPRATVHLTELGPDGDRRELHVCRDCVARLGLSLDNPPPLAPLLAQAQVVAEVGEGVESVAVPAPADGEACPQCGLEFAAYAQNNLFGCAECYSAFMPQVAELVQRYHGAQQHVGRTPGGALTSATDAQAAPTPDTTRTSKRKASAQRASQRHSLRQALAEAVAREQFERAATLRDQLAALDAESGSV